MIRQRLLVAGIYRARKRMAGGVQTWAIGSVLAAMRDAGWIDEAEYGRVEQVMADMYAAVERDEQYRPSAQLGVQRRLQQTAR